MLLRLTLFFLIAGNFSFAQRDTASDRKYYLSGNLKAISIPRGTDTIELRTYFKNGQPKDSLNFYISNGLEIPIKTCKTFYKNGKPASISRYGKNPSEYVTREYYQNGRLKFYEERPTGLIKYFNKRGRQTRQYDLNKMTHIYVPKRHLSGWYLRASVFAKQITTQKAMLVKDGSRVKIRSGALISVSTIKDTNLLAHCLVEGFSKDSVYLSSFVYNDKYDRETDFNLLKYKKTFSLGINQVRTIYYTKHSNAKRRAFAQVCFGIGFASLIIPMVAVPGDLKEINTGEANLPALAQSYGAAALFGISMMQLSNYLYKTTVPKKYEFHTWKLVPEN